MSGIQQYKINFKDSTIQELAKEWMRLDKNPTTLKYIDDLLKEQNFQKLEELLREPITFGTAGLRARMEGGFSRMNDLTVIQASQGLSEYVSKTVKDALSRGIVIGYDHRYNSERFAKLTAAAFLTKGFKVYLYSKLVHTPLVPFGIKELGAACGVMITASHNPKLDNGYKVYWENACQIVEPHDKGIAKEIENNAMPWCWDTSLCDDSDLCTDPYKSIYEKYFEDLKGLSMFDADLNNKFSAIPKFVYTAMHGVGGPAAKFAFEKFNVPEDKFIKVAQQYDCDPDFPTVPFPNPEEKGALNLALEQAEKEGAQYVLANDPDADRFACAEKLSDGRWIQYTGNQIGTLLAAQVWEKHRGKESNAVMIASTVSSKMISSMGEKEGFQFKETLTGFKWMGNAAMDLEKEGKKPLFAFEEAIGYMVGDMVKDKDGISAMVTFVELATRLNNENKSVYSYLMELYHRYNVFVDYNSYYFCNDATIFDKIFNRIRYSSNESTELNYPKSAGGLEIVNVRDLTIGHDSSKSNLKPDLPVSASTQMITFQLRHNESTLVLTLRTSGTEPKLKYYSELCQTSQIKEFEFSKLEEEYTKLKETVKTLVEGVLNDLIQPKLYNLNSA
ncbi:hypothetical protein K502DRAFT_368271 [Neoconidiobolus thromboides FSU 785]|nr:hypothetical protein K502DRAFT_368271 [Neoconidiobolus thromboides FSU 785]